MNLKDYIQKNNVDLTDLDLKTRLSGLVTEARLFGGISQAELAKRMSTTQSSIARAESGLMEPSVEFLERVASAVGTELQLPKFSFMVEREQKLSSIKNNVTDLSVSNEAMLYKPRAVFQVVIKRSHSGSSFSQSSIRESNLLSAAI